MRYCSRYKRCFASAIPGIGFTLAAGIAGLLFCFHILLYIVSIERINYHKSDTPKDAKLAFVNISGIVVTRASALAVVSVRALRT